MYWYESRARTNLGGPDSVPAGCAVFEFLNHRFFIIWMDFASASLSQVEPGMLCKLIVVTASLV